jgi:hypothetical protein
MLPEDFTYVIRIPGGIRGNGTAIKEHRKDKKNTNE